MTNSVLFDAPGPKTVARHRLYTILTGVALAALVVGGLAYLGSKGELAYELWEPFVTPDIMVAIGEALLDTLQMAFLSVIFSVVFGLVFGVAKMSDHRFLRWPAALVVEFFRAVPVLLNMVFVFFFLGTGDGGIGPYWSVVLALTLYNGSVLAEVFRAGILAVPRGQSEAAYALGMRKTQVMNLVLLPQAVKIMIPAIISQCVVAVKDTSLGMYIIAPGLTYIGKQIWTEFGNQLQTAVVLAALYILVNFLLTVVATWVQRRFVGEKALSVQMTALVGAGDNHGGAV